MISGLKSSDLDQVGEEGRSDESRLISKILSYNVSRDQLGCRLGTDVGSSQGDIDSLKSLGIQRRGVGH